MSAEIVGKFTHHKSVREVSLQGEERKRPETEEETNVRVKEKGRREQRSDL